MQLAVVCNEGLKNELIAKGLPESVSAVFVSAVKDIPAGATGVMDLLFEFTPERLSDLSVFFPTPVLINSVSDTLAQVQQPFIRINAWPGFLNRDIVEISCLPEKADQVKKLFKDLTWNYILVPDVPGMVSARIVAMIINEAWYTFGAGVSSKEQIDIAMKLGTNYPYGPFEWGALIGWEKIVELLSALSKNDIRYKVAPSLADYMINH